MARGISFAALRDIGLTLPEVEESTSYGTPALKVRGKLLARLREDGESVAVKVGFEHRDLLLQAEPETFFTTDHYNGYPIVLLRLGATDRRTARDVLEMAWRHVAPKRLQASHSLAEKD